MRYCSEDDLAALAPISPGAQRRAKSPLDHRYHCLYLPALAVSFLVALEALLHRPPPATRWRLVRESAPLWRNDGPRAHQPKTAMYLLCVKASVAQQRIDSRAANGMLPRGFELCEICARPTTGYGRENHVAGAVDNEDDLRQDILPACNRNATITRLTKFEFSSFPIDDIRERPSEFSGPRSRFFLNLFSSSLVI
jgi:hypothetical protein